MENENDLMRTVIGTSGGGIAGGSSNVIREIETEEYRYTAGPLNLNRYLKRACTIMGRELAISAKEFNALDMLVSREGEYLTFDELYQAVWGKAENPESKENARESIDNLLMQVCNDGEGFMWIEYLHEAGYMFKTHWGKNWDKDVRTDAPVLTVLPKIEVIPEVEVMSKDEVMPQVEAMPHITIIPQVAVMPQADADADTDIGTDTATQADTGTATYVEPTGRSPARKPIQRRRPQIAAVLAGVGAIAAAIILMLLFLFNSPLFNPPEVEDPVYMEIDDPNIPLAPAPDADASDAEE